MEKLYPYFIASGWLPNIFYKFVVEVEGCKCRRRSLTYTTQFSLRPVTVAAVAIHSSLQRKIWKVHGPRTAEICSSGRWPGPKLWVQLPLGVKATSQFGIPYHFSSVVRGISNGTHFKVRGATSRQHPQCFCISRGRPLSSPIFLVDCHDDAH